MNQWVGRAVGRWMAALAATLSLGMLGACGGGGAAGEPPGVVPSAVTTGFTQGAIGGFGSIFVNGVRFDDSSASVLDDRGGLRSAQALKLGMQVEIEHSTVDALSGSARANVVRFGEAVRGPVSAVDVAGNAVTVLGQKVLVRDTTVFDASVSGRLASIQVGMVLEVHGLFDAGLNAVIASRIERQLSATSYKLRGIVAALNAQSKTFSIGAATINYTSATDVPAALANGLVVRVELLTTPVAGQWQASEIKGGPTRPADRLSGHVRGIVTAFTSNASFSVNGLAVDARSAAFPDGTAGLALGAWVEVEGTMVNGVLVASKVEIEASHRNDDNRKIVLNGDITALSAAAKTLVVKGTTVSFAGTVAYNGGSEAALAVGKRIQVKGSLASDGSTVQAVSIRFE